MVSRILDREGVPPKDGQAHYYAAKDG